MFGGGSVVLTIGKLGKTAAQLEYFDAQVAAGVEDYYAGRGESPGRWRGSGIAALGLQAGDRVRRIGFLALMRGVSPVDGAVLRVMGQRSTVAGLDLTFSAPKSVSVLFAVADEDTSSALLDAHERAVDAALAYLEREACFTRRGRDGVERLRGEGFIAASYRHRMSRAGDPQLHTHVVVANLTRAEGRYTALDAHAIYEHKSAAGAVYRAVLRAEARERLPWISWRPAGRGLFEIDGISEVVLRHFSQRRAEIEQRALELAGVAAGELSRERMQGIALQTRRAKQYGVNGGTWRDEAHARAAEHGFGHSELVRLQERGAAETGDLEASRLAARLSGPAGLTSTHNTFAGRHALAEIAGMFEQGASVSQLEQAASRYLEDPSVRSLASGQTSESRYTTEGLLACEREIVQGAERRAGDQLGALSTQLVERVLARHQPALNDDQAAVVRAIVTGGRGVDAVTALAGTGKTTMIGALAACYEQAGGRVVGVAPTARAARELRDVAGVPAGTMHSLLGSLERGRGFAERTVLVVDEAGMAPTRLTAQLFGLAERAGVKVIAVGDPGQLRSVQAGGWLGAIARCEPTLALEEVMRQRDPRERAALKALRDGDPDDYLVHKHDDLNVHQHESEALDELAQKWHAAQQQHGRGQAVMIARDNHSRERLNQIARGQLKDDRVLPQDGVLVGEREYAPGDRVIARRNDRAHNVDNGTLATVLEIDQQTRRMQLLTDSGQTRELDGSYVAAHVEHAYALTGHGAQGATFTWAGVTGRPEEFTREWAYTALSRARETTTIHVIGERSERQRERDEFAPAPADRDHAQTVGALRRAMRTCETELLALEQIDAHQHFNPWPETALLAPKHAERAEGPNHRRLDREAACAMGEHPARDSGPREDELTVAGPGNPGFRTLRSAAVTTDPRRALARSSDRFQDARPDALTKPDDQSGVANEVDELPQPQPPRPTPPNLEPDGLALLRRGRRAPGRTIGR